jgi:hypothetical protein
MNEDHSSPGAKHDVWSTREVTRVCAVAVTQMMKKAPDCNFRPGILPFNARHQGASLLRAYDVAAESLTAALQIVFGTLHYLR